MAHVGAILCIVSHLIFLFYGMLTICSTVILIEHRLAILESVVSLVLSGPYH